MDIARPITWQSPLALRQQEYKQLSNTQHKKQYKSICTTSHHDQIILISDLATECVCVDLLCVSCVYVSCVYTVYIYICLPNRFPTNFGIHLPPLLRSPWMEFLSFQVSRTEVTGSWLYCLPIHWAGRWEWVVVESHGLVGGDGIWTPPKLENYWKIRSWSSFQGRWYFKFTIWLVNICGCISFIGYRSSCLTLLE